MHAKNKVLLSDILFSRNKNIRVRKEIIDTVKIARDPVEHIEKPTF
jgi:hypothetical protein